MAEAHVNHLFLTIDTAPRHGKPFPHWPVPVGGLTLTHSLLSRLNCSADRDNGVFFIINYYKYYYWILPYGVFLELIVQQATLHSVKERVRFAVTCVYCVVTVFLCIGC